MRKCGAHRQRKLEGTLHSTMSRLRSHHNDDFSQEVSVYISCLDVLTYLFNNWCSLLFILCTNKFAEPLSSIKKRSRVPKLFQNLKRTLSGTHRWQRFLKIWEKAGMRWMSMRQLWVATIRRKRFDFQLRALKILRNKVWQFPVQQSATSFNFRKRTILVLYSNKISIFFIGYLMNNLHIYSNMIFHLTTPYN